MASRYSAAHLTSPPRNLAVPVSDPRLLRTLRLLAAGLVAVVTLTLLGSAAAAQTDDRYGGTSTVPTIEGTTTVPTTVETSETTEATVLGRSEERGFAITGGDVIGLVAIGGGAVAVGTALVLAARRRRALELA
jgi:hypothetical protein